MNLIYRALIAGLSLSLFFILMAGFQLHARNQGEELILDAAPVDPRDMLHGHYVALTYPAERLNVAALAGDDSFREGEPIHVVFDSRGAVARPAGVYRVRPAGPEGPVLTGRVTYAGDPAAPPRATEGAPHERIVIADLRLPDRYYADKETALALEGRLRDGGFQVILGYRDGRRPVLKGLIAGGERRYDSLH